VEKSGGVNEFDTVLVLSENGLGIGE